MKAKIVLFSILAILLLVALGIGTWYHSPLILLEDVEETEVASISVFNGATGRSFVVKDPNEIAGLVGALRGVKLERSGISENYDGFAFSLSFFDVDGNKLDAFIINSDTALRKDPFFYRVIGEGELCFDLLQEWEAKYCPETE